MSRRGESSPIYLRYKNRLRVLLILSTVALAIAIVVSLLAYFNYSTSDFVYIDYLSVALLDYMYLSALTFTAIALFSLFYQRYSRMRKTENEIVEDIDDLRDRLIKVENELQETRDEITGFENLSREGVVLAEYKNAVQEVEVAREHIEELQHYINNKGVSIFHESDVYGVPIIFKTDFITSRVQNTVAVVFGIRRDRSFREKHHKVTKQVDKAEETAHKFRRLVREARSSQ